MKKDILPLTVELLKSRLSYDPDTGLFTHGASLRKDLAGKIAGHLGSKGYVYITIFDKMYFAHRLAFLYMTGKLPLHQVDHIDGIKHNNRWNNLRDVTGSINARNLHSPKKHSKTKLLGSCYHKMAKKYRAKISKTENGKQKSIHLGYFETALQAHEAYLKAKSIIDLVCEPKSSKK